MSKLDIDQEEFVKLVKPVIKFLNEFHPHVKIIITTTSAEFVTLSTGIETYEFLKD